MKIFSRSTQGDPTQVIKDVISKMTFKELTTMAAELAIPAHALSDWADGTLTLVKPPLPTPANDNPPTPTLTPIPNSASDISSLPQPTSIS